MPNWKARFEAVAERLPDLDPVDPRFVVPPWVNVADLRKLYCATLASDDIATDERVEALTKITDPLRVLSIVAPYIPVREVTPPAETAPAADTNATEPALPINIGEGGGSSFTSHGTTTETDTVYTQSKAKADAIAKEQGGTVKGYD